MIIGVTGPLCSGIDTFADILKKEHGFIWFSYSDILREEARKKGVELTRTNLQDLGDELRRSEGLGVLSKRIIEKLLPGKNYVCGNLRNPGEFEVMKNSLGNDFILIKIEAPQKVRFERLLKRRREKDPSNFEDFVKMEERDLGIGQADYGQQHAAVFPLAEKTIVNDSTVEDLAKKARELVRELGLS